MKIKDIFRVTRGSVLAADKVLLSKIDGYEYPVYSSQTKADGLLGYYNTYLYENAITWTTDGANAGTVHYRAGKFYCTNVCGVLLNKDGYANRCTAAILGSISKKYVSYVGNPKLMNNIMSEIPIIIPALEEQHKIDSFIAVLDKRIKAQQMMITSLKKYKRGALKAVFNQQASFVSESQKWDEYTMRDLISLQSGQDFAPAEYNDQGLGIPYMTGASCIVNGETVVSRWTQTPRCYAYRGDTLLVCKGSGSGAVVRLSQEKVHIARQFMSLRPNEKMTSDFCYYLTVFLSDKIKQNATGLIEGIDRGTVLNQTVFLPPLHEQKKIASYFSKLDFVLSSQEIMLDKIMSERTGLMQQLFI